jgi:hypothetical protein
MGGTGKHRTNEPATVESAEDMAVIRHVMENDWVALRALALGDEYPNLDVATLVKMAEEEKVRRQSKA